MTRRLYPHLITTRTHKPPIPRGHRQTLTWEDILRAKRDREAA